MSETGSRVPSPAPANACAASRSIVCRMLYASGRQMVQMGQAALRGGRCLGVGEHAQTVLGGGDAGAGRHCVVLGKPGMMHKIAVQSRFVGRSGGQRASELAVQEAAVRLR